MKDLEDILFAVSIVMGVSADDIKSKSRKKHISKARMIYYYFSYKEGFSGRSIGFVVGRKRSTVSSLCSDYRFILRNDAYLRKMYYNVAGEILKVLSNKQENNI